MAKYNYQAKNLAGEERSGSIEAENKYEVARILRQEGYILVKAGTEGGKRGINISFSFSRKVSLVSKLMFIRNLRVLVAAGVSLPRSLTILSEQSKSKKMKKILLQIKEDILKGRPFSDCLGDHPEAFSDLFVNMIRVGEETGTLEEVLKVLANQLEKDHQLRSRVKSAMIYPLVIILAMMVIGIVMLIFVVPKLADVFEELGVDLPFTTQMVMNSGDFLAAYWYLLIIGAAIIGFLFKVILSTKRGRFLLDAMLLNIPAIGGIVKKTNSAYMVRTLSSLISAGVPIVRSLEIVSSSLSNVLFRQAVIEASEEVRKGAKLSDALSAHKGVYPALVIQMIEVGGETGETADILKKLAEFFEEEVVDATKNLSTIIEPVLMLIIGAVVAFFAISMIQPIYGMMETL